MKKFATTLTAFACALCLCFGLAACGESETVAVESVKLSETALTLEIGEKKTLTATVSPDNATDKTVTWKSDHSEIATVDNGEVKAVAEGTASITASAGGKSATCSVTVKAPTPTNEVTADEWRSLMANQKNFKFYEWVDGLELSADLDDPGHVMSWDGDKVIVYQYDGPFLFVSPNASYCFVNRYVFENGKFVNKNKWAKENADMSVSIYASRDSQAAFFAFLGEHYKDFVYKDGAYTCASLTFTSTVGSQSVEQVFEDIKVVFENKTLMEISYSIDTLEKNPDGTAIIGHGKYTSFGRTKIEIPTEYDDHTTA